MNNKVPSSQTIYSARYKSQADLKIFEVGYESQADLID